MELRNPVVAGQFYPGTESSCKKQIEHCLASVELPDILPDSVTGGIVPHAGWTFSGTVAAALFAALKRVHENVDTFVIFGAAHGYVGTPALYAGGAWQTPLGRAEVDEILADDVLKSSNVVDDRRVHSAEHSIEVQLPFVQLLFPQAKILPILVPPAKQAVSLGDSIGKIISENEKKIVCIGSTDLTHYGPNYGFTPMGIGEDAIQWATKVNDKEFIDLAIRLDAHEVLKSASKNHNACGAGAAAAVIAAARQNGKNKGILLDHKNSNQILKQKTGVGGLESVGYAAIIF